MAIPSKNNLKQGINLDIDNVRMPPNAAAFIKNLTQNINVNAGSPSESGSNAEVLTPIEGNQKLGNISLPLGANYCVGSYSSEQTNELYFAVYNSGGQHSVFVISGDNGSVTLVYQGSLLPFVLDSQYFYSEGRMTLELRSYIDPATGTETNFKFLIFTNNYKYQCLLDVQASIATGSYSTPYFTDSAAFYNPLELIHYGVTLPIKAIGLNSPNAYVPMDTVGVIDSYIIDNPGSGYSAGPFPITISRFRISGGNDVQCTVTEVDSSGRVLAFSFDGPSSGYTPVTGAATTTVIGGGSGLTITILSVLIPDSNQQNLIINEGWQFRIRTWDVWGRPSDWGIISNIYTPLIGGGCFSASNSLPRCVNICFDAGNPLVKFIDVAYRRGVGNDVAGAIESGWFITETFRKYNDSQGAEWYAREYNPVFTTANSGITFDQSTNVITYTFCADKQANPVDPTEAAITEPGLPITSSGVFSVSEVEGLANNVYDFNVPDQAVTDSIQFGASINSTGATCPAAFNYSITVYAAIWNPIGLTQGFYQESNGIFIWGNSDDSFDISCGANNFNAIEVDQVWGDQKNPGFIAYLAGTNHSCVGVQGAYNITTGAFTPVTGSENGSQFNGGSFPSGTIPMIQFIFNDIPAGDYVCRVASHKAKSTDTNLQYTSTYVGGVMFTSELTLSNPLNNYINNPLKEIEVNCQSGNLVSDAMFVILDLSGSAAIDGYLYEQNGGQTPVEMSPVFFWGSTMGVVMTDSYGSFFTDHNGFYFACGGSTVNVAVQFFADFCSGVGAVSVYNGANTSYPTLQNTNTSGTIRGVLHGDGSGSAVAGSCKTVSGNWFNPIYFFPSTGVFPAAARRLVFQNIFVCSTTDSGVPGVVVVLSNCGFGQTNADGFVSLVGHNRYDYVTAISPNTPPPFGSDIPDYSDTPDFLIFGQQGGGCQWNTCDSTCHTTILDQEVPYLACGAPSSGCATTQPDRTFCAPIVHVKPNGFGITGVQSGGKYPVAFWLHDVIGRHTSPIIKQGANGYVSIPNINDYQQFSLCSLNATIPAGLTVDPVFTHITFLVGDNMIFDDFFTWSADQVQYVNNAGQSDLVNPTAIRIYFNSLNEYNKLYNFQTNIGWDFLTTSKVAGAPADICQFITNGANGSWLSNVKGSPVTYDQYGSFFTVDYISELAGLTNGCLFRIIRPTQNVTETNIPYFEQSLTLSITNGALPAGTWTLPYQDSYLLARTIPVPLLQGNSNPVPPGSQPPNGYSLTSSNQDSTLDTGGYSQNNANNSNDVIIFQIIDNPTSFWFFFESPSPSDLWGSHLKSLGRIGIPNPYEMQYRNGTEIALSENISNIGYANGMSTYINANSQSFPKNTFGDITVVLVEQGICMVICNNDFFTTRYNQTQLQVSGDQVFAQNPNGALFTQPDLKVGLNYGVIPSFVSSIAHYNGMVVFLDAKGHLIFSNFSSAKPTEREGYMSYILQKIAAVNHNNTLPNSLSYFVGGIDPKTMEYNLTSQNLDTTHVIPPSYVNQLTNISLPVAETLIFDLYTGLLKTFASYTPEMYGRLPGFFSQRQFFSFKQGIPWFHHNNEALTSPVSQTAYTNFYDTQCGVVITIITNGMDGKQMPDKVKRFLYNEIYCRQSIPGSPGTMPTALFYANTIVSEKGQTSRLLVGLWTGKDGYWCSAFLCNINTPVDPNLEPQTTTNALYDGDPLQGRWLQATYLSNSAYTGQYFEMSSIVTYFNELEKSAD